MSTLRTDNLQTTDSLVTVPVDDIGRKSDINQRPVYVGSVANLADIESPVNGSAYGVSSYHPGWAAMAVLPVGGGVFVYAGDRDKSQHNGGTVISPTVPWDGTQGALSDFLNGVGETNPGGTGVFVRADSSSTVNVFDFGARGDFNTVDTPACRAAIAEAERLVVDRFKAGATVHFGRGGFLLDGTLTVTSSNVALEGVDWSSTSLYAPDANFDLVHFDGSALTLYGCGMSNIRLDTPGTTTAGAQLRTERLINANFENLYFVGHWVGLACDSCARTYFTNVIWSQETRLTGTSPSYGIDFISTHSNNSDVHVNTFQIFMPDDRKTAYSISIRGADGIYFNNGHQQGGVLVQPDGIHGEDTTASCFWSQVYLDKADSDNIIFTGAATNYRNFIFNGVYLRGSQLGMVFNNTGPLEKIKFVGGEISGHTRSGVEDKTGNVSKVKLVGVDFSGNCSGNQVGDGDVVLGGSGHIISAANFQGGAANSRAVLLKADAVNAILDDLDFTDSDMGEFIEDNGVGTKIGIVTGATYKAKGTATIPNGSTSVVVNHGLTKTPDNDAIQVTARTSLLGGGYFWTSDVTSTTFRINTANAPTNNIVFSWVVDMTGV